MMMAGGKYLAFLRIRSCNTDFFSFLSGFRKILGDVLPTETTPSKTTQKKKHQKFFVFFFFFLVLTVAYKGRENGKSAIKNAE